MNSRTLTRDIASWPVVLALALPLIGLAVLLARPELDHEWQHQPSHFWLVLGTAAISVGLALLTNEAASRRADGRIVLVSLAFLASSGFLALHALATPGVLLPAPNAGFVLATPIGLAVAAGFAAASATRIAGPDAGWVLRHRDALRGGVILLLVGWAAVSLLRLPPLDGPPLEEANLLGQVAALVTLVLYGIAAVRFFDIGRRRRSTFALMIGAAFVLLAEAMIAVAFSRSWHLSWWEWHLLMTAAFVLIAIGARREYRRTGSLVATFGPAYLETTLDRIERWHGRAIADLAAAEARGERVDRVIADLRREGASGDEVVLLERAAREVRRVDGLFRPYVPDAVADRLRATGATRTEPEERTVTVLFVDLAGFTAFSETHQPTEVLATLNAFWETAVPIVTEHGGSVEHFAGDAVLVTFNAVDDQPDHVLRAARCALRLLEATDRIAAAHPGWPRFRAGINTGPAAVGTVGGTGRRSVAAIGDTTNLGARLSGLADPGGIVVGERTHDALAADPAASDLAMHSLGPVTVKGKRRAVAPWALTSSPAQSPAR
jgi:class 3 adenylate cyclase